MPSIIVLALVGAGATYVFLWALAYLNQDPREPQPISGSIPFISPLVGLVREKESFYMRMRQAIFAISRPCEHNYYMSEGSVITNQT